MEARQALRNQHIEVGRARRLQLRGPAGLHRESAEPVDDEQDDLRVVGIEQILDEPQVCHGVKPSGFPSEPFSG